ncbi:hypothetical protein [Streptomyces sp. H27-D2]|uniref:hypothetical protein n=1 Tax=Streptomyces sp. H27-D2 TaxID=3046304 RepID=UPI002DBB2FE5|nr:hypothetical protein [Streptomyces sp. H27-D2]MEC4019523.1 hypothetical protein [Streptomyces sp. H27-D2]
MKQGTIKTLGVVALGAAAAVAAAGSASAAGTSLDSVVGSVHSLPVQQVAKVMPGVVNSLESGTHALGDAVKGKGGKGKGGKSPVASLIGGLPLGKAAGGLGG